MDKNGNRMSLRDPWGVGDVIIGFPFLVVGVVMIFLLFFCGETIPSISKLRGWERLFLPVIYVVSCGMSVGFAIVGACFLFMRQGTILDRQAGTIVIWRRFLFWASSREHAMRDFTAVRITSGGSFRTGPRYAVCLEGPATGILPVATVNVSEKMAIRLAEEISGFTRVPYSSGTVL
ncbi:MAG: hypothetical protein V1809_16555 [Planctomycetota bacterium]